MYKHLDLARNSFKEVINIYGLKKIYLPYYLCDVMRHSCFEVNCKPEFYHVDDNFLPAEDFKQDAFILYPNYFGICDKNVKTLSKIYPNLIVDNAHSYFSKPEGRACFNSKRKFIPSDAISDLWVEEEDDNRVLDNTITLNRSNIFNNIHTILETSNLLTVDSCKSPFCYPYLAEDESEADKLVNKLKNIEIYRYWNELPKSYNEYKFYSRLVPIPLLDQVLSAINVM